MMTEGVAVIAVEEFNEFDLSNENNNQLNNSRRAKDLANKFSKIEAFIFDRDKQKRLKADSAFTDTEFKKKFTTLSEIYSEIEFNACGIEFMEFAKAPITSPELLLDILENLPSQKRTDAIRALALVLDEKKYVAIKRLAMQREKFDSGTFSRNATTASIMQKVQVSLSPETSAYKTIITKVKRDIDDLIKKYPTKETQEKNKAIFLGDVKKILEEFYTMFFDAQFRTMIPTVERDQCAFIYQSLNGQNITENQKLSLVGGEFFLRFFALLTMEYEATDETRAIFTNYVNYFLQKISNDLGKTVVEEISGDSLPIDFFKLHFATLSQKFANAEKELLSWLGQGQLHQWQADKLVCNLSTSAKEKVQNRAKRQIDSPGNHYEFLYKAITQKTLTSLRSFFVWIFNCYVDDFNGHHFDLDTERTDGNGDTLFDLAIKHHLPDDILMQLLNLGFEVSFSSLLKAIECNNAKAVQLIREKNERRSDGYPISRDQLNRALLLSLQKNHFEIAEILMQSIQMRESADPKCEIDGSPLIHHLVMSEGLETTISDNNNNQSKKGSVKLKETAIKQAVERYGVNINQKSSGEGWTVLHVLTMQKPIDEKMCCFVINQGGDFSKLDLSGNSAFDSITDSQLIERLRTIQSIYEKHQQDAGMENINLQDPHKVPATSKKSWGLSRRDSTSSSEDDNNKKGNSLVSKITLGLKSSKEKGKEQKEQGGAPLAKSPSPTTPSSSKTN